MNELQLQRARARVAIPSQNDKANPRPPLTVLSATLPLERKRAAERGGNRSRYNLTLFMLTLDVINLSLSRSSPSESSVGRWLLLRVAAEARSLGELSHSFGRVLRVGCVSLSQARSCWRCRE